MEDFSRPTTKVLNNSWNAVDRDTTQFIAIVVDPILEDRYDESMSSAIDEIYIQRQINDTLFNLYVASQFYAKYKNEYKRIDKDDMYNVYTYFRDLLYKEMPELNIIQIFCSIMEFFSMNYDKMYHDVISIEDKSKILETLYDVYGHRSKLNCVKLF